MILPFPCRQLFEIHGSKPKLDPIGHLGQASVLGVAHAVLFLRVCKYTILPRLLRSRGRASRNENA